ncbi:hypothetical protein ACF3MZ_24100 [Paenibacillaceae bacterium WGS1546]|uniref:hypothetical protein n=1 Tax=Cohnella sp. WGS1546 TaxID=3366810 RepID=UPI00372D441B
MRKKKGVINMSPTSLGTTRKQSFLTDARKIIQKAIQEKGLTKEQIKKSLNENK